MADNTPSLPRMSSVGLLWPVVAVMVSVLALVTGGDVPLVSSRPAGDEDAITPAPPFAAALPGTHAQLWEDPLEAARRIARAERPAAVEEVQEITKNLTRGAAARGEFLVLPVLTRGGPYPGDHEDRMRSRYAVLSALGSMGFTLSFPQRMSAVTVPVVVDLGSQGRVVIREITIPIKLYGTDTDAGFHTPFRQVLLLWINEMQLGARPLQTLSQILQALFPPEDWPASPWRGEKLRLCIVGPTLSDTLVSIVEDDHQWQAKPDAHVRLDSESRKRLQGDPHAASAWKRWFGRDPADTRLQRWFGGREPPEVLWKTHLQRARQAFRRFHDPVIYSPRSTVSWRTLGRSHPTMLPNSGVRLVHVVGSDLQLARALAHELDLRSALPHSDNSGEHIVLVTERDTLYGRQFPATLREVLGPVEDKLYVFNYFVGIDGQILGETAREKEPASRGAANVQERELARFELPEGTSQRDYLRRLANEIVKLNTELHLNRAGRVSAIGVVGSDIFDKLLVLRALRSRFPDVCFFSTDLDARYMLSTEVQYTRNLIVASHYGLGLNRSLEFSSRQQVPPFRDSYQTSTFLATLRAIECVDVERRFHGKAADDPWGRQFVDGNAPQPPEAEQDFLQPMMFEIGRTGAFQLSVPTSPLAKTIQPLSNRQGRWWKWLLNSGTVAVGLALLVYCLSWYFSPVNRAARRMVNLFWYLTRGSRRNRMPRRVPSPQLPLIGIGLTLLLLTIVVFDSARADGEPFTILEGISIWPSVVLRYLAILWVILLVFHWRRKLDKNLILLRSRFLPQQHVEGQVAIDLRPLLDEYAARTSIGQRLRRVFPQTTAFFVLTWCVHYATDNVPGIPTRGAQSWWIAVIVTQIAYFALLFSVFFVLDVLRQSHFFFKRLAAQAYDLSGRRTPREEQMPAGRRAVLNEVNTIRLIVSHSRVVGRMVIYPFLVALLLATTRLSFMDNWSLSLPYFLVVCSLLSGLLFAGFILRGDAQKARMRILERLRERVSHALGDKQMESFVLHAEAAIAEIERERGGAFRPLAEDPAMAALLIPFGGTSTLILVERMLHYL